MKTLRALLEIAYRCTLDHNRHAWRSCYKPIGGWVYLDEWDDTRAFIIFWADWVFAYGWPCHFLLQESKS